MLNHRPVCTYSSNLNVILNEQKQFYKTLFTSEGSDQEESNRLLENVDKILNRDQNFFCDSDITEQEIKDTIKLLKVNKSPGDDGIVSEFYKEYFYLIRKEFSLVLKHIFATNTLFSSQYNAILTLLYKKGVREDIRNWRPISLLNVDYKIITKILDERLKKFYLQLYTPIKRALFKVEISKKLTVYCKMLFLTQTKHKPIRL